MDAFDTDDWDDDDFDASLEEATWVSCPYCGETVELLLDPSGGSAQEYVEDCEVCCRPWNVRVQLDDMGQPHVDLGTLDEE